VREAAGAFGGLGTLIPFLVGYLTITKLDPVGVLVAFGIFKIAAGLSATKRQFLWRIRPATSESGLKAVLAVMSLTARAGFQLTITKNRVQSV
jgi:hypothetical protein